MSYVHPCNCHAPFETLLDIVIGRGITHLPLDEMLFHVIQMMAGWIPRSRAFGFYYENCMPLAAMLIDKGANVHSPETQKFFDSYSGPFCRRFFFFEGCRSGAWTFRSRTLFWLAHRLPTDKATTLVSTQATNGVLFSMPTLVCQIRVRLPC